MDPSNGTGIHRDSNNVHPIVHLTSSIIHPSSHAQLQFGKVVEMLHRAEIAGRAEQGVHHPGAAVPCVAHDAIACNLQLGRKIKRLGRLKDLKDE